MLFEGMSGLIHRTLRREYQNEFSGPFGRVFESYVQIGLDACGVDYETEQQLQARLGDGKVADFLVKEGDVRVWIDAKGIELPLMGMVAHDPDYVCKRIEKSVLKGLEQIDASLERLGPGADGQDFVLLVTYDDLLLGNGEFFVDSIGARSRLLQPILRAGRVLPERIFFMSIREFDTLISHLQNTGEHFGDFLSFASERGRTPERKWQVAQYLVDRYGRERCPSYLLLEFDRLYTRLSSK